jgi:hypothetical protein
LPGWPADRYKHRYCKQQQQHSQQQHDASLGATQDVWAPALHSHSSNYSNLSIC